MNTLSIPFNLKCKSCASRGSTQDGTPACARFKIAIKPEEDGCSWHTPLGNGCAFCGQVPANYIAMIDEQAYPLCESCYKALYTCQTCRYVNECGFRNDHSEPQVVMKQVQQGYMTLQTQVKNPKLVDRHCRSCRCSSPVGSAEEPQCLKDSGIGCQNWVINIYS